jgi:hypothetical protein
MTGFLKTIADLVRPESPWQRPAEPEEHRDELIAALKALRETTVKLAIEAERNQIPNGKSAAIATEGPIDHVAG